MTAFIPNTLKLARYYKSLGEQTMNQLSDEELLWSAGASSNSIAAIVKHLWGNMLSRWTNFLTEDGEKPWRQREAEFDNDLSHREEVLSKWNEGWKCFLEALESLQESDLEKIVYIRNEGHTVVDAIQRQMAHYPYHVGQMVFIGKLLRGDEWNSLSIPKGQSEAYNTQKFTGEKRDRHFTDQA